MKVSAHEPDGGGGRSPEEEPAYGLCVLFGKAMVGKNTIVSNFGILKTGPLHLQTHYCSFNEEVANVSAVREMVIRRTAALILALEGD